MSSESGGDFSNIGWIHIGDITMVLSSISSDLTSVPPPLRRWPVINRLPPCRLPLMGFVLYSSDIIY